MEFYNQWQEDCDDPAHHEAGKTVMRCIDLYDGLFGEGYAKDHPELITSFLHFCPMHDPNMLLWQQMNQRNQQRQATFVRRTPERSM